MPVTDCSTRTRARARRPAGPSKSSRSARSMPGLMLLSTWLPCAAAFTPLPCARQFINPSATMFVMSGSDPFDVPRPDPAILVSAKDGKSQQLWVAGIGAGLTASTAITVSLLSVVEDVLPDAFGALGNANAVPLGLVFAAIGAAHFAKKEIFLGIVPPKGTWGGLWQVPAPGAKELQLSYEEFHTFWTGAAEIAGGLLLAASGVGLVPATVQRVDALFMLLLCVAVTPANVYMCSQRDSNPGQPPCPLSRVSSGPCVLS